MHNQKSFAPVNKNAIPEARKLLEYLYSIRGKKIIAGHHNSVERPDIYPNRVKSLRENCRKSGAVILEDIFIRICRYAYSSSLQEIQRRVYCYFDVACWQAAR